MRIVLRVLATATLVVSLSATADWVPAPGKVTTTDKVGIGTSTPAAELHVATESATTPRGVLVQQSINSVNSPFVIFRKSRGTIASPLAIQPSDGLGTIYSEGYDGTSFVRTGAFLKFIATGVSTGAIPTDLSFGTGSSGVGLERMRITSEGKIGIGTATPLSELHMVSDALAPSLRNLTFDYYTNDGNGTLLTGRKARGTAAAPLALQTGDNVLNVFPMGYDGSQFLNSARVRFQVDGAVTPGNVPMAFQVFTGNNGSGVERMRVTSTGIVTIGTTTPNPDVKLHVAGNAQFDGTVSGANIKAHYQDLAEWVPSKNDLAPGTVVVLDASIGNGVMASNRAYDTAVAGVVSAQPGIILGEEGAAKEQVATTGRVRVKVDASRGAIAVGDLLVTSDKAGYAMRSTPIDVAGVLIHRPGTIVGKALESLVQGEGEILVLLSLQ